MPGSPEGGQGGPSGPVQEARAVREGLGDHRGPEEPRRDRQGRRDRGGQGWTHRGHRSAWVPARLPGGAAPSARVAALHRQDGRGQDHRAGPQPQQRRALAPGVAGGDSEGTARRLPQQPQARRAASRGHLVGGQLRGVRRPRRDGRAHPRLRAQLEAHRSPEPGRVGGRRGGRRGARRRLRQGADLALAEGHPAGPVAGLRGLPRRGPAGLRSRHQAGALRCLRPGGRRDRGPRAHLRDGGAPRRVAGPGRERR